MKLLKTMSVVLSGVILLSASAYAKALRVDKRAAAQRGIATDRDILLHDYMTDNLELPEYNYTYSNKPGQAEVRLEKILDEGKERTVLSLFDNIGGTAYSGVNLRMNFSGAGSTGKIGFKTRFKMIPIGSSHAGMRIYIGNDKANACRFGVTSTPNGNIQFSDEVNSINLSPSRIEQDKWYTLTSIINMDTKTISMILESDCMINPTRYDDLPLNAAFDSAFGLNSIFITTQQYDATWYFDYMQLTKDPEPLKKVVKVHPPEITPPFVAVPEAHGSEYDINVLRGGRYCYFTYPPVMRESEVYVTARSLFNIFDMNVVINSGKFTGENNGKTIEFSVDKSKTSVCGKDITEKTFIMENQLFVSLNRVSELMGEEALYDEEENTLKITEVK